MSPETGPTHAILDDYEPIRKTLSLFLQSKGVPKKEIISTSSLDEALQFINETPSLRFLIADFRVEEQDISPIVQEFLQRDNQNRKVIVLIRDPFDPGVSHLRDNYPEIVILEKPFPLEELEKGLSSK